MIKYKAKIKKDSSGYAVSFPDLPGCYSYASTLVKAQESAVEALDLYLEEASDPKWPLPKAKNHRGSSFYWICPSPDIGIPLMIREARIKRGFTMKKASELLGMKVQTYQKLEYPYKSNPTAKILCKIACVFKTKFEISG